MCCHLGENPIIGSFFLGKGGGVGMSPYCILPNVNFKACIFLWKIKSKPDHFSGGYMYMLETTPEIKITMIYDSAKFRNV